MSSPTPGVRVQVNGRKRTFRYTNRALVEVEEETGMTVPQHAARIEAVQSNRSATAILWGAMIDEDPDLAFEDAVELIELDRLDELADAAMRAYRIAYGDDPDADEDEQQEEAGDEGN